MSDEEIDPVPINAHAQKDYEKLTDDEFYPHYNEEYDLDPCEKEKDYETGSASSASSEFVENPEEIEF